MKKILLSFTQFEDHANINLSNLAKKVIESDRIIFEASANKNYKIGTFVNTLISNYDGDFSLNQSLLTARDLNGSYKFRLNKDTLNFLNDEKYQKNIKFEKELEKNLTCPQYLKCLLETYARLPFIEREKFVLKNSVIEPILNALSRKQLLCIKYKEEYKIVTPIFIAPSKEGSFQYLVAKLDDGTVNSYRLSRIESATLEHKPSKKLSEEKLKEINEDLSEFGPTFIGEEKIDIKVRLSKEGADSYKYSVTYRPIHTKYEPIDDGKNGGIYTFHCTKTQALFFFFRFAGKAEILEPKSLRDEFGKLYQEGLENYLEN